MPRDSEILVPHRLYSLAGWAIAMTLSSGAYAQPASTAADAPTAAPEAQPSPQTTPEIAAPPALQEDDPDYIPVVTERRGGFVIGVIAGPAFGWARGNPSDKARQYDPDWERNTGLGFGYRITPFLGGALTDWFTFGLGASFGSTADGDEQTGVGTFVFHLEAFPLYEQGGVFRDLGLSADFGAGQSKIRTKSPDEEVANSGVASTVGVGAFWEPWRIWNVAGGPYVGYQRNWSRWFARNDVTVGLRLMFYGNQPE